MLGIKSYKILINTLSPLIMIFFFLRVLSGKEDKQRFLEKFSLSKMERPPGSIVWIHACSVGEVKSSYNLIKNTLKNNELVLVTTSTYLSGLDVKKSFAEKVIHQYLPLIIQQYLPLFSFGYKLSEYLFVL